MGPEQPALKKLNTAYRCYFQELTVAMTKGRSDENDPVEIHAINQPLKRI